MNKENDDLIYDEDEAIGYIEQWLKDSGVENVEKDNIEYIMDVMYDYYESEGLVNEDVAEEADIDEEAMFNYIVKAAKKDEMNIDEEFVAQVIEAEYQFGVENGIYLDSE